jgi:hypothetical protein
MKQATDVAGTGAKALNFTRIDAKVGVQTGIGAFTTNTQAAGQHLHRPGQRRGAGPVRDRVQAVDLDVANGFDCVQLSIPDTGAAGAQLICGLYLLRGARYAGAGLPSAIVD